MKLPNYQIARDIKFCRRSMFRLIFYSGYIGLLVCAVVWGRGAGHALQSPAVAPPTFYRDVLPILQQRCQVCHRQGGIAPMAFQTFLETRPYAAAIRKAAQARTMPPWFALTGVGKFSNDPSLTEAEIAAVAAWVEAKTPAGDPRDAPRIRTWSAGWIIPSPDMEVKMPAPAKIPASGDVEYTYEIVPTHFSEGRWVRASEILPGLPEHVHHAVVYIRPPNSNWLRHAPIGKPFTASTLSNPQDRLDAHGTTSDLLLVYAPGSSP